MFAALETRRQRELRRAGGDARRQPDAEGGARHLPGRGADRRRRRSRRNCSTTIDRELAEGRRAHRIRRDRAGRRAPEHAGRGRPAGGSLAARPAGVRSSAGKARQHRSTASRAWTTATFRVVAVPLRLQRRRDDRHAVPRDEPRSRRTPRSSRGWPARGRRSSATVCWWRARSRRARRASSKRRWPAPNRRPAPSTLDGESHAFRRLVAVGDTVLLRARLDRRVVTRARRGRDAQPRRSSRVGAVAPGAARQLHAGAAADRADRPAVGVARRDGGVARRATRDCRPADRAASSTR